MRDGNLEKFFKHENQSEPPSLALMGKLRLGQKSDLLPCFKQDRGLSPPEVDVKDDVALYKYAMPVWVSWWNVSQREDGFPEGRAWGKTILPRGDIPSGYPHWHGIFVLLHRTNPNLVKYQWKQQWLPVDPVRTVDVLPVYISPVDMMEWPTFVSQSRLTIFMWGIIIVNMLPPRQFKTFDEYARTVFVPYTIAQTQ